MMFREFRPLHLANAGEIRGRTSAFSLGARAIRIHVALGISALTTTAQLDP
jgi:hypothetical protein